MDDIRKIEEDAKKELDNKILNSEIGAADTASVGKVSGMSDLSMN